MDDLGGWGRILMGCQMKVEAFAYQKLLGFLSIPVKLLYLREFDPIVMGRWWGLLS